MNKTETEDRNQNMREFVLNKLTDQTLQQEILKEFVMKSLMDPKIEARKHEIIRGDVSGGSK